MKNSSDERAARERETTPGRVALLYRYSVSKILALRKSLEAVLREFEGTAPRGPEFDRLVQIAYEGLPGNVDWQTLEDSLRHLAGTVVTPDLLRDTCWRLAGNYRRLNQRKPVPPWHVQRLHEWAPAQVVSARPERSARGVAGTTYGFRLLAGTACPRVTWKWWSTKQVRFFAPEFGFSRPGSPNRQDPPKYLFDHPAQFVGLRLWVLLDPDLSGREPVFSKAAWPASVTGFNRLALKRRFRVDEGYDCPRGFPASAECHRCPVGFKACPNATHREDWTTGRCPQCEHPAAVFDPELSANLCIDCYTAAALRGSRR